MSLRSSLRDDFPSGWWHSPRWWWTVLVELIGWLAVILGTFGFFSRVIFALSHRHDPSRLSRIHGERFLAAMLVNAACCGWLMMAAASSALMADLGALVVIAGLWSAANATAASVVMTVLGRSRLHKPAEWMMLDYIDQNTAPVHRPPETIEEYRAQRMNRLLRDQ